MERRGLSIYLKIKYLFDKAFSITALLFLSPVILLIMILIILDDPKGSPVFTQIRVGENGKKFKMYKFRTMHAGAEKELKKLRLKNEMDGPPFKMENDPRITRTGRFLRKSGLDELLQFINVLNGEMSIVGPRPPLPEETVLYDEHQKTRLSVRPGITCYWQVMPDRNKVPFEKWVELDLKYIKKRSPFVDIGIILSTIGAMIRLQGE